jgi:hypothetical protein
MALFSPTRRFNREDLPAFGLPSMTVLMPSFKILPFSEDFNNLFNQNNQHDYRELPAKVSNAVLKKLGNNITSFWGLYNKKKNKNYDKKVKLPKYLHKTKGRFLVEFNKQTFSKERGKNNELIICKSSLNLKIPTLQENPQQVRITPKKNYYVIEVVYEIIEEKQGVKAVEVAKRLDVRRSSVTEALKNLAEKKLVNYECLGSIDLANLAIKS